MPSITGPVGHNDIVANSNALVTGANIDPELLKPADDFDKDTFLQLMVAQLKYQNPLEPMDSAEFMAQTAQFTTVEKLTELTDQLGEQLANERMGSATGMIGRDVTYASAEGMPVTERVNSVRFNINGPLLITAGGAELSMGQIAAVSAPGTIAPPVTPPVAAPAPVAPAPATGTEAVGEDTSPDSTTEGSVAPVATEPVAAEPPTPDTEPAPDPTPSTDPVV